MAGSNEIERIAFVVESLASAAFPERLATYLRSLIPVHAITMFVHRAQANPVHLFNDFQGEQAKHGITEFIERTFVLNPFYQAHLRGLATGIYRIADLAPDTFFDSEYYRRFRIKVSESEDSGYVTNHWPEGLTELDVAVRLDDEHTAEIALYRQAKDGRFIEAEIDLVRSRMEIIGAMTSTHWKIVSVDLADAPDEVTSSAFAEGVITAREREILELVLQGHSSESIALRLSISLTTVKSHRKNAYEKLGISTQAELFKLFLAHLKVGL